MSYQQEYYISIKEAAKRLDVGVQTLYTWVRRSQLGHEHGLRRLGGRWLLDWDKFREAIDSGATGRRE